MSIVFADTSLFVAFLSRRDQHHAEAALWVSDFEGRIVPATPADFESGVQLYEQRPDQEWSLTDCISFHVMRRENITEALTADHHFEQAGFAVLLKAS